MRRQRIYRRHHVAQCRLFDPLEPRLLLSTVILDGSGLTTGGIITIGGGGGTGSIIFPPLPPPVPAPYVPTNDDLNLSGDVVIDATTSIPDLHLHLVPHVRFDGVTIDRLNPLNDTLDFTIVPSVYQHVTSITYIANSLIDVNSPPGIPFRIVTPDGTELAPFIAPAAPVPTGIAALRLSGGVLRLYRLGPDGSFGVQETPLEVFAGGTGNFSFPAIYTFQFNGDANYAPAMLNIIPSATFANLPETSVTLTASPQPQVHQSTSLIATVTSEDGTIPDGLTAYLRDESSTDPNTFLSTVVTNGVAAFPLNIETYATRNFEVIVYPNDHYDGSVSEIAITPIFPPLVDAQVPFTLTSRVDGASVVLDARFDLTGIRPDLNPTGFVTFSLDDGTILEKQMVNVAHAYINSDLTPGDYTVHASYEGDGHFAPASATLQVHADSVPNPLSFNGQSVYPSFGAFTFYVYGDQTGLTLHELFFDGRRSRTIPLRRITGNIYDAVIPVGWHYLQMQTPGHALLPPGYSNLMHLGVVKANPAITLQYDDRTQTLDAGLNTGQATGVVVFYDRGKVIGAATLRKNGHATLRLLSIARGTHNFYAMYQGDRNFNRAASAIFEAGTELRVGSIAAVLSFGI